MKTTTVDLLKYIVQHFYSRAHVQQQSIYLVHGAHVPVERCQECTRATVPYFDLLVERSAREPSPVRAKGQVVYRLLMARETSEGLFVVDRRPQEEREVVRSRHQPLRLPSPETQRTACTLVVRMQR